MAEEVVEFVIQTLAGIVGVFAGVWLALIVEKRKRAADQRDRDEQVAIQFDRAMQSMLGSVIKNMAEAKRIGGLVDRRGRALIHEGLEMSVWDATQDQFIQLCDSVDKRVLFAQFFSDVRHLQAFCDFHRGLQLAIAAAGDDLDPHLAEVGIEADIQLKDLAEELILCGRLLIADYGQPVHRRLLGMNPATT